MNERAGTVVELEVETAVEGPATFGSVLEVGVAALLMIEFFKDGFRLGLLFNEFL